MLGELKGVGHRILTLGRRLYSWDKVGTICGGGAETGTWVNLKLIWREDASAVRAMCVSVSTLLPSNRV